MINLGFHSYQSLILKNIEKQESQGQMNLSWSMMLPKLEHQCYKMAATDPGITSVFQAKAEEKAALITPICICLFLQERKSPPEVPFILHNSEPGYTATPLQGGWERDYFPRLCHGRQAKEKVFGCGPWVGSPAHLPHTTGMTAIKGKGSKAQMAKCIFW